MRHQAWHKRHAIQLAAQLPENDDDALIVLGLTMRLVVTFMGDDDSVESRPAKVVPIGGGKCG